MTDPLVFRIHGMDCADEVAVLRRQIEPLVGSADRLTFDILRGKMRVAAGTPEVTTELVLRELARTGMRAEPWQEVQPGFGGAGLLPVILLTLSIGQT